MVLTQEGEGFPGVGDSISEHQRVSSLQNFSDQTPNRTLEHLPLTGLWAEHLNMNNMKNNGTGQLFSHGR